MIHEEICTYNVCKLAKEKGFNVPTFGYYRIDTEDWYRTDVYDDWNDSTIRYSAPTQSLLQKWLREEKGLHITVPFDNNEFWWQIKNLATKDVAYGEALAYSTYELALEDALKYALENLV